VIYDFISESLSQLTTSRTRSWGKGRGHAGCANPEEVGESADAAAGDSECVLKLGKGELGCRAGRSLD